MLETIFLTVNNWIAGSSAIAAAGAFLWGVMSVLFSPCHLASIPLIVGYVGGQQEVLRPKRAASYAILFTLGLFITIALIGIICLLLGRMLGDVGNYWQIPVGLVLIWAALGMFGLERFAVSGNLLSRVKLRGLTGAFLLGLGYGILSGSCTFGFIAPILAIVTVQEQTAGGIVMILLFAVGHSLPIVAAGSSAAAVRRILENSRWQEAGNWFRKGAGALVGVLGLYFVINPFFVI